MKSFWDKQIERAGELAAQSSGSKELVAFYLQLLRAQKQIYDFFRGRKDWLPSGELETDLEVIRHTLPTLLEAMLVHGPSGLSAEAQMLLNAKPEIVDQTIFDYWRNPSDLGFFPKAILQPYARWLIESGAEPIGRELAGGERACPFCGSKPQVSFLQSKQGTAEGGDRNLTCATCLSSWEFRRVVCANCGEERPAKLAYFHSPEFDHIRIEACDTCRHYIKGVDLTRLGHATPLVDEIYSAPLDLWAREHGYTKIELNLVGL